MIGLFKSGVTSANVTHLLPIASQPTLSPRCAGLRPALCSTSVRGPPARGMQYLGARASSPRYATSVRGPPARGMQYLGARVSGPRYAVPKCAGLRLAECSASVHGPPARVMPYLGAWVRGPPARDMPYLGAQASGPRDAVPGCAGLRPVVCSTSVRGPPARRVQYLGARASDS